MRLFSAVLLGTVTPYPAGQNGKMVNDIILSPRQKAIAKVSGFYSIVISYRV